MSSAGAKMVRGPAMGSCGHAIEVGRTAARCLPCATQKKDPDKRFTNGGFHRSAHAA